MTEKITGIVLDIRRHNDRHNIVTLFTRSRGRVAFLTPAGGGKGGRLRNSRLQPLAVVEADVSFRQNVELQKLPAVTLREVWTGIYFHPVKPMVVLFLSEFLNRLLKASMPDEAMFDYIVGALALFDGMATRVADFHIVFLSSLLPFLGIQPDISEWAPGRVFDMRSGTFTPLRPPHNDCLSGDEARWAALVGRLNFSNFRALHIDVATRSRILEALLRYYSIHFPGTGSLRSVDVIRDVLHG